MIQVYPFHGTDVQETYDKLNCFLSELAIIDVLVAPENVRSNTKYYPDWDRTATTIEVCIDFSGSPAPHEIAEHVRDLHRVVANSKPEQAETPAAESDDPIAEAYRLVRENGTRFVLDRNSEGYFLTDTSDQGHVFWGVYRDEVLGRVRQALGIQPVTTPASDDFDPFLDSADLP